MPGDEDQEGAGTTRKQLLVGVQDDLLLARMRGGGEPDGASVQLFLQGSQLVRIGRCRSRFQLHIAGQHHRMAGEILHAVAGAGVCGPDPGEFAQQTAGRVGAAAPIADRCVVHAGIDQGQWNVAGRGFNDQIGPDLRFREHGEVWLPVVEKAAYGSRGVDGHELVDGCSGEAAGQQLGRGGGAGRDQEAQVRAGFGEGVDQCRQHQAFANTGAMQPNQNALRPGLGGVAQALAATLRMFLASAGAAFQQKRQDRRCQAGQPAIP